MQDPFAVLGLSRSATAAEIKQAFRKLAMAWHPDRNTTREAETRFKHIKAAYEIVSDPERLAEWDAEHPPASPDADATSTAATDAAHLSIELTLEEAAHGCVKTLVLASESACPECAGSGRERHPHSVACRQCKGVGRTRGGTRAEKCTACGGRGYVRESPCGPCHGSGVRTTKRMLEVRIPAAILPGERLRLARQHRPRRDAPAGDLFVTIVLRPHAFFRLEGRDLECEVPVGIFSLLAGGVLEIPTLDGSREIEVAPYPRHGLEYRLPGLGFPGRHGRGGGAMRLRLTPIYPRHTDEAGRKLLARLHKAMLADADCSAPELAQWARQMASHRPA